MCFVQESHTSVSSSSYYQPRHFIISFFYFPTGVRPRCTSAAPPPTNFCLPSRGHVSNPHSAAAPNRRPDPSLSRVLCRLCSPGAPNCCCRAGVAVVPKIRVSFPRVGWMLGGEVGTSVVYKNPRTPPTHRAKGGWWGPRPTKGRRRKSKGNILKVCWRKRKRRVAFVFFLSFFFSQGNGKVEKKEDGQL